MKYPFTPWSVHVLCSCARSCATMRQPGGANGVLLKSTFPKFRCRLTLLDWFETVLTCSVLILLLIIPYPIGSSEMLDHNRITLIGSGSSMFEFLVLLLPFSDFLLVLFDISILLLRFLRLILSNIHFQFCVILDWWPPVSVCYAFFEPLE